MSERWVCHKSGQGEKWKCVLQQDIPSVWFVFQADGSTPAYLLPRTEYIECAAPEVWIECTREVIHGMADIPEYKGIWLIMGKGNVNFAKLYTGYRWAWRGDALVIERRQA